MQECAFFFVICLAANFDSCDPSPVVMAMAAAGPLFIDTKDGAEIKGKLGCIQCGFAN